MTNSINSMTEVNGVLVASADSSDDSSVSFSNHHGYHYHPSSTASIRSRADTVSTQSFIPRQFANFFEDANSNQTISLNTASDDFARKYHGGNKSSQAVNWTGDADNEYIFGSSWSDIL